MFRVNHPAGLLPKARKWPKLCSFLNRHLNVAQITLFHMYIINIKCFVGRYNNIMVLVYFIDSKSSSLKTFL